ncbi:alpha-keto acid decarboxylase family protein [Entomobacter blattae]|uniref:pyruvate decarboxylase n=1 Tax=Entomobacter blattae TaxID=2762277 RepID=A0A7H1NP92_9PROT|nr:thiamine pyrophosphate-dependent enzyme [Entomobacter blattae]QNT77602.1 Pyruvate decarboxylase [Entomobacter blattae]
MQYTVGRYLAERFAQIGIEHHFAVAGDYNLILLDELLEGGRTKQVYCSNELNCGFAAEGYARARGIAAAIVTFNVGAFSALNAIGGANAENLPVILVSGAPNTNDLGSGRILHHTIGTPDYSYQLEIAKYLTCAAESIIDPQQAPAQIDRVIRMAVLHKKPVYLEIACNLSNAPCAAPGPIEGVIEEVPTNHKALSDAVDAAVAFLKNKKKPTLLIGTRIRSVKGEEAAVKLSDSLGCAVATMASSKSYFPESNPHYIGTYWGEVSDPGVQKVFDTSDAMICLGTVFNDYSTSGWTSEPYKKEIIQVHPWHVEVGGKSFSGVHLRDFVLALAEKVTKNSKALEEFKASGAKRPEIKAANPSDALTCAELSRQIQGMLNPHSTLFLETGDSWFHGVAMTLPKGARVESEMQWGHIGWSVPSVFGYAVGAAPQRQVIAMIGDGSFQLTAQEVAQMIRNNLPVIIFLLNNNGYTIEVKIHDGPYNRIKNWDYAGIIAAFNAQDGEGKGLKAGTGKELEEAIKIAVANKKGPTLIECALDSEDCATTLVKWGKLVAKANSRPRKAD